MAAGGPTVGGMEGSGLIYAAIVAAWLAYLVPSWVRRGESRTTPDRHNERMRVVASSPTAPAVRASAPVPAPPLVSRSTARRRRHLLVLLVLAVIGIGLGTGLGRLAAWAPAVPALMLVGYVMLLRRSVRRTELAARRARARAEMERVTMARPMTTYPAPHVSVRADVASESADRFDAEATIPPPVEDPVVADDGTWEPVPVPLPTYVTAPKARRAIRTIDLATPGAWTSGRLTEPGAGPERELGLARAATQTADATVPQPRAVGD